ncbi:MAG: pyridoxal-dependent decarboxylase [bacterium]|nr:pyridoxal-dependent decarboxylase [bacterium]
MNPQEHEADQGAATPAVPHMTPDELRLWGERFLDWVAGYHERIESFPVLSQVRPGEVADGLPQSPPAEPEGFDAVLDDLERVIVPGLTHWQSPGFFAFFPTPATGPAILGDLLSSGLGVQGMLWASSPACTELESRVLDWLVELCGLPQRFRSDGSGGGVIQDSASSAALCALVAARERALNTAAGATIDDLVVYTSQHAHSSIYKSARIAGFGADRVRYVGGDPTHAMSPEALAAAVIADRDAGLVPCAVVATVGTTSSLAFDPVARLAAIAGSEGMWTHVDGALAGAAAVCPEFRFVNRGLAATDSYCFNPHKWLLTNLDCTAMWVADREALTGALSVTPEYLRNPESEKGTVIDYRDWQVPLGRRFRSLKLWLVLRWHGAEGLQAHIRSGVSWAQQFAGWVREHPDFSLAAPAPLNLVCFRHRGGDESNRRILDAVNEAGRFYITHTVLDGQYTLRLSVGTVATRAHHVEAAWEAITEAAARL